MLGDVAMDGYWESADLTARVHPDDRAALQTLTSALLKGPQQHAVAQFRLRVADG